jgi:hypothetical protein
MLHYVPHGKNSQQSSYRVFHQYPTFNWVSFNHIQRLYIQRNRHTYLISCNNIVNFFKIILLCTYLGNCWLLC